MSELIIGRTFLGICQNLIGFFRLFEGFFCGLVIRIAVRMVFHRKPAVGLFEISLGCRALNTQHLVIIPFCHNSAQYFLYFKT